jgi:hypothetical protein
MATIARVLSLAFPASQAELETLKVIGTFCGVGLVVSLLLATYGLDISVGFFWPRLLNSRPAQHTPHTPFQGLRPLGMVLANVFARTCEDAPAAPNRLIWSVRNETPASF